MSDLRTQVEAMRVEVSLPDGSMFATVTGAHSVRIGLRPGTFESLEERELATKLERLSRLTFAARKGAYDQIRRRVLGAVGTPASPRVREERARLEEILAATASSGSSADGSVTVDTVSLAHWSVRIEPGATQRLDETGFVAAVNEAAERLVEDHRRGVARARMAFFPRPSAPAAT